LGDFFFQALEEIVFHVVEKGFELDGGLQDADDIAKARGAPWGDVGPTGDGGFAAVFGAAADDHDDGGTAEFFTEGFAGLIQFFLGAVQGLDGCPRAGS
jgi:hypothetical protein